MDATDPLAAWNTASDLREGAEEDALLLDALAFIGDLGGDADATADEDDVLSRLLQEDDPGGFRSLQPVVVDPLPAPVAGVFPIGPVSGRSMLAAEEVEPLVLSIEVAPKPFAAPRKWPSALLDSTGKDQNGSRTRRRDEILYLRDLVGTLEKRLTGLRSTPSEETTVPQPGESDELTGLWAQVATRQYQRRQDSEAENIKLRRLLQDQIQLGKSLERLLLKKRPTVESLESSCAESKRIRRTNSWSWKSSVDFEELIANCARQYGETAAVLAKFTDGMFVISHRDFGLVHDPDLGLTVQTKERRILPFSYEDTASEIWGFYPTDTPAESVHDFYDVDQTEDTMKLRVRVSADINRTRGEFSVTMVMRRYVGRDRTVIVMSGIALPSSIGDIKMDGMRMRTSGWIIVEPLDSRAASKLTAYHVSVPEVDDVVHDHSRNVGMLTNFLLSTMVVELDYRSQQWENRLFQRALNRRK